jgi:hypothetical protein
MIRQADPTQRERLIDVRSTSVLAKERELAKTEDRSVNWMFPPPRYSQPVPLAEVTSLLPACLPPPPLISFFSCADQRTEPSDGF